MELLKSLQRALVDVVCHVGVDINMALSYNHYSSMLPFIGGLGLRKADALLQNIRASKVGIVECRKILLEKKLLTRCIYMNAAGFIRICKSTAMTEYDIDPLDDTRIHPECYNTYDFATKICAEALEVDNKRDNYFETVRKTMADVHKQLEDVIFDDGRKIARGCSEGNAHVEEQLMNNWVDWKAKWRRGIRPGDTWSLVTIDDGKHADYWGEDSNKLPDYNELCDILSELELEKYAASVEASGLGKRIQQFNDIKEELRYPWLDMVRILTPVTLPSADLMFTLSTGELYENLHVGLKVTCVVKDITEKRAFVTVDDGLKGSIDISQVAETNYGDNYGRKDMHDYLSVGSQQTAVIIRVNKERCTVELSVKPSYLELGEDMWMRNRFKDDFMQDWMTSRGSGSGSGRKKPFAQFDRYFDESKALDHYAENEKKRIAEMQQSSTTSHGSSSNASRDSENAKKPVTRLVYHPLFTNCNYHEAEENLRGREVGAVVIRPSSKGGLSITWKFQENMYCHVEVEERGKRMGDIGLGKELYIKDIDEPFSDIDEIYSRYVMPKNEFVSAMIASKNFRAGSMSQVEESLKEEVKSNPQRIPYCVHIDENKPGWFVLSWIISASSKPLKSQYVLVSADVSNCSYFVWWSI